MAPSTVGWGLRAFALGAIGATLGTGDGSPEAKFLLAHLNQERDLSTYLQEPAEEDLPLLTLAAQLRLHRAELLAIALATLVETDLMSGRAIAHIQSPVGGSRPSLGLLGAAFASLGDSLPPVEAILTGAALQSGLLTLLNEGAPAAERALAVPLPLCLALRGHDTAWPGTVLGMGNVPAAELPPSLRREAERQAAGLGTGGARALVVRSNSVSEGRTAAARIAEALGRRALFIDGAIPMAGLAPWMILRKLLPVFCFELAPAERKPMPALPHYDGPVLALCGPEGSIDFAGEPAGSWNIPVPPRHERAELWTAATGNPELAARLARHYRHSSGRISHLGRLARHRAALDGRQDVDQGDIHDASWIGEGSGLDALAQPIRDRVSAEALVMPPSLRTELDRLHMRCLARDGLVDGLGVSAATRYRPGVRALFTGASGTGKTLAAGWLATRLGLPLYRVDLASVTSKYIGETEKNLAQLMARAEQAEVVLLFDEADSLFGSRTDIRDANDRFANAQTNYLLQRMETFDGIAILTSNSRGRFDSAFARRLDAVIEFPLPGPDQRREIWEAHLGVQEGVTRTHLNRLAVCADLNGGNIRNAVLSAAVLAQSAQRAISYGDLVDGLTSEYRKLGKQMPVELLRT